MLVERRTDTQSTTNAFLILFFFWCYVNFISFCSPPHNPFYDTRPTTNALRTKETYSLLSCFVFHVYGTGIFSSHFIAPERTKRNMLVIFCGFLCYVKFLFRFAKNSKFCKIHKLALAGGTSIAKKCKTSIISL